MLIDSRGITRWCPDCPVMVTPPGVLAPYQRGGHTRSDRQVKSQRETDLEALALADRKGIMLADLRKLAADEKLHPGSVMQVEWFAEQVKSATAGARLDALVDLFSEAGIRRRHWWQDRPTLSAGYDDEEHADYDEDDEPGTAVVLATPASVAAQQHRAQPHLMTWDEALSACGWSFSPLAEGCQVIDHTGQCQAETVRHIGSETGPGGWVCSRHDAALCRVITDHNRRLA